MSRTPAILPSLDTLATRLNRTFNGRETEDNWESLELMFRTAKEAISCTPQSLLVGSFMKAVAATALEACLLSERTRLATSVMEMCRELAAHKLEASIWDLLLTQLLKVCERANKVFVLRAKGTIEVLLPSIPGRTAFGRCAEACSSPNKGLRLVAMELLAIAIKCHGEDVEEGQAVALKRVISEGLSDASGPVRDASRAAMHALIQFKPQSAREMLGKPRASGNTSAAMSVSSMSRASSSVLRAAKVVTADGQSRTILGPQRIPSGAPEAFAAIDGVAPKRALRVASSMLANSVSTSNLRASRPVLSSRNNPLASTSPASKPLERVDSQLQRLVQGRPTSRSALHLQHALSASTSMLDVNSVKFAVADALKTGLKSTDWSVRQQVVDKITGSIDASEGSSASFVGRCLQVAITALSDSHVRVQQAGVALCDRLVETHLAVLAAEAQALLSLLEVLLVRLFAVQSQLKSGRQDDLVRIASLLVASLDANSAISLFSNAFSRPEVIVSSRLKGSLVSLVLAHISKIIGTGLQDAGLSRSLFSRLALLLDEPATSQLAAECFAKLYDLNPASYYVTVQQCVKSLAARKLLQQSVGHPQSHSKAVIAEGKETLSCVTPTRPSGMAAQEASAAKMAISASPKTPSTCATPSQRRTSFATQAATATPPTNLQSPRARTEIELTVRKRIESAIRQVMRTPLSLSTVARFIEGQRTGGMRAPMSVDTMVEKVRARIRVALTRHEEAQQQDEPVDAIIDEIRSLDTLQKRPPSPSIEDEQDWTGQAPPSPTLSRIPHGSSKNEQVVEDDDGAEVEALLEAALQQFFASSPATNHPVSHTTNDVDDEDGEASTMRQVLDCIMATPLVSASRTIFISSIHA